jgi:hypothetical protein
MPNENKMARLFLPIQQESVQASKGGVHEEMKGKTGAVSYYLGFTFIASPPLQRHCVPDDGKLSSGK